MAKIRIEQERTFSIIMDAVRNLTKFIAPTFGPRANKVIIDKQLYRMVVDDGVQIARDYEVKDAAENAVVKVIKETAIRTNDRVGDGTTGSLIILHAIMEQIASLGVHDGRKIKNELKQGFEDVKNKLLKIARPIVSRDDIERVARISFDNPEIAKLIADTLHKIGKDGSVILEKGNTMETIVERHDGIEFNQGYVSPYMITDPQRAVAELEKPYILVTSYRLTNANDVLGVMNALIEKGKRELLLVCESIESDALATIIVNRMQGKFVCVAVQAPQGNKEQFLQDIATLTGATLFTESKGNRLDQVTVDMLGRAGRALVRQKQTTIVGGKGKKAEIEEAKNNIKALLANNPRESEKQELELRLARFLNGVAVIKVGAPTETEQKELKYKVEDAVNATKAAMRSGVVPGAGRALSSIISTTSPILNNALKSPSRRLFENMGIETMPMKEGEAYNFVTAEKGDYFKVGVIDPVEVLIAGVESAVSIASVLVTTHGILVEEEDAATTNA